MVLFMLRQMNPTVGWNALRLVIKLWQQKYDLREMWKRTIIEDEQCLKFFLGSLPRFVQACIPLVFASSVLAQRLRLPRSFWHPVRRPSCIRSAAHLTNAVPSSNWTPQFHARFSPTTDMSELRINLIFITFYQVVTRDWTNHISWQRIWSSDDRWSTVISDARKKLMVLLNTSSRWRLDMQLRPIKSHVTGKGHFLVANASSMALLITPFQINHSTMNGKLLRRMSE